MFVSEVIYCNVPVQQGCGTTAPTGQILPAGQTSHSVSDAAPDLSMTRPGGQA